MLRHSWLLIYRNIKRFKSTFFINLIGLSSGLVCALFIFLWVSDELYMDKFHEKKAQLFQIMTNHHNADGIMTWDAGPGLLAEGLSGEMPEIEYAVSTTRIRGDYTISVDDNHVKAAGQFADKDFFDVFSYELIEGKKEEVLTSKDAIVISEKLANSLFKTTRNIIGKAVTWQDLNSRGEVFVSGVMKDVPASSSEKFDFLLSFEAFKNMFGKDIHWKNHNVRTYLVLKEGTDIALFNSKIAGFIKKNDQESNVTLLARKYSDAYLYGRYENGVQVGGRIEYVKLFTIIAIFILVIACINFMNLSTAKATVRVKEVGIKKAIGAQRQTLIVQYIGESVFVAFLALVVALVLVVLFLPKFNEITGKDLVMDLTPNFVLPVVAITLLTGFIAGSYPALYLSGFSPAKILKGNLISSAGEVWTRRGLVVFQFSLSCILIASVLVVYRQIEFIQTKNLGYNRNSILYFPKEGRVAESLQTFLDEATKLPGVVEASSMWGSLAGSYGSTGGLAWEGKSPDETIPFANMGVNYNMIELLGIEMKSGRSFSKDFGADSTKLIVNEAAVKVMGLKNPIGATVNLWNKDMEIIGETKNFHFESLQENIKPFFFRLAPRETDKIVIKVDAGAESDALDAIRKLYESYNPGYVFNYKFLDDEYRTQYVAERRVATLSKYFAGLAIIISCMGLFGLAAFTTERKFKEIGIRKVLGASEFRIFYFLSNGFTKLVFVSILVALPASYFIAKYWLDGFAYRVELQWWYFASTGLIVLLIAWITVGMQVIKASRINPLQCLRDE